MTVVAPQMDFLCKPRVQKAAIERAKSNVAETSTAAEEAYEKSH